MDGNEREVYGRVVVLECTHGGESAAGYCRCAHGRYGAHGRLSLLVLSWLDSMATIHERTDGYAGLDTPMTLNYTWDSGYVVLRWNLTASPLYLS